MPLPEPPITAMKRPFSHEPVEREGLTLAPEEEGAVGEAERTQAGKRPLVGEPRPIVQRRRRGGSRAAFRRRASGAAASLISIALMA